MLRKCATAVAVSLVCLSGQAFAQQAPAKAAVKSVATSSIQRVGAPAGQTNQFEASPWLLFVIFGVATTAVIIAANDDDDGPTSP